MTHLQHQLLDLRCSRLNGLPQLLRGIVALSQHAQHLVNRLVQSHVQRHARQSSVSQRAQHLAQNHAQYPAHQSHAAIHHHLAAGTSILAILKVAPI